MTKPTAAVQTDSPLMTVVLTALSAMMRSTLIDPDLAHRAAREAVAGWEAKGETDLLAIGQIVAYALTVVDSLRLSFQKDVPPAIKVKLRTSANSAGRVARAIAERLARIRTKTPVPEPVAALPEDTSPANMGPTEQDWIIGIRNVAAKFQAEQATASPEERQQNEVWIGTLNAAADEIAATPDHPGLENFAGFRAMLKADDPGFPIDFLRAAKAVGAKGPTKER